MSSILIDADINAALSSAGEKLLHVEGPEGIYAFLRAGPERAVVHVVNWNVTPSGKSDSMKHVTLQLLEPARWGEDVAVEWFRPQATGGSAIEAERHAEMLRITLPELETWGVLRISGGPQETH